MSIKLNNKLMEDYVIKLKRKNTNYLKFLIRVYKLVNFLKKNVLFFFSLWHVRTYRSILFI